MLLGETERTSLNVRGVVFVDPLFEKTIRDLQLQSLSFHGEKGDGFDPDVEILLTDPLLQRVDHSNPKIFHGVNLDGLGSRMKAVAMDVQECSKKKNIFIFN